MKVRKGFLVPVLGVAVLAVVALGLVAAFAPDNDEGSSASADLSALSTDGPWPTRPDLDLMGDATATDDPRIEGVPVPNFVALSKHTKLNLDAGLHAVVWDLVDGASRADLEAFYAEQMPEGADFGEWQWCRLQSVSGDLNEVQRLYERSGTAEILDVTVTDLFVLVGVDESGPCTMRD